MNDLYGNNGSVSVPPPVILKLVLLLVLYNVRSERELMETVPERLDWLWFLGYDLQSEIPDHSVLSKARKQFYTLESKLETIRQELLAMRTKVRDREAHWRNPESVRERHLRLCERLHVPGDLYSLEFSVTPEGVSMSFRKDVARVQHKRAMFGKSIIITHNMDWSTSEIVQASLDRWQVEDRFRQSKDDDLVAMRPVRHWTDSKIQCHLFCCVVAMTLLRRVDLRLRAAGIRRTAEEVMEDLRHLHSVLMLREGGRKPDRRLEIPTKTQAEVLSAFGFYVDGGGVLHPKQI